MDIKLSYNCIFCNGNDIAWSYAHAQCCLSCYDEYTFDSWYIEELND